MILDGVLFSRRDQFLAAVAKLPPQSRLNWHLGCDTPNEIPLGPEPRLSIPEFQRFCRQHAIDFDYKAGFSQPVLTRTFSVLHSLRTRHPDARTWLESQGVTFPPKSSARWSLNRQRLIVRNTTENLELTGAIIAVEPP